MWLGSARVGEAKCFSADCQNAGCVFLGGDMSGVLAACGLRNCVATRNNPGSEPGLLPGRNEAFYWSPWGPSPVSAISCSTSESP